MKVYLIFNPHTGKSKSFGYVEFARVEDAESALQYSNHTISGKQFFVERHKNSLEVHSARKEITSLTTSKKAADKRIRRAHKKEEALIAKAGSSELTPRPDLPAEYMNPLPALTTAKSCFTSKLNTENSLKSILIRQKLHESHTSPRIMCHFAEYYQHIKSLNATVLNHYPSNCRFNNESEHRRIERTERTTICVFSSKLLHKHAF